MAIEIEHKYLVVNDNYKELAYKKVKIRQGYLNRSPDRTVRIRTVDDKGFLTVKGRTHGAKRLEFEYEIPYKDALHIFQLAEPGIVIKTRYFVKYDSLIWEIDEFSGSLKGVVIAEVELPQPDMDYRKPDFIGANITGDPRFYNSNLLSLGKSIKN